MTRIEKANGYIEFSEDIGDNGEEVIIIDNVVVKEKRQGTGKELVKEVVAIADAQGKSVELCAYPINNDITLPELVSFYESCGFSVDYDDGIGCIMNNR